MLEKIKDWCADTRELFNEFLEEQDQNAVARYKLENHSYPSFLDELPYQYFDEESQIFLNKSNAGVLYRITPLTGGNEKLAEKLDSILRTKVSHDFTLQMIFVKHNQVAYDIDNFARQFSNKDFPNLSRIGTQLRDFYKSSAKHGFKTRTSVKPRLTHTECFMVIDCLKTGEAALKAKFGQFRVSLEAALRATKIGFKRGGASDFLSLIQFYLSNCPNTTIPTPIDYDKRALLKDQLLTRDFDLEVFRDNLKIRGTNADRKPLESVVSVLTIDKLPTKFHLWENINNSANVFYPEQTIPCNHIISVIYKVDPTAKAQDRANRKTRGFSKKAKSDYALLVPGTNDQAQNWRAFRDDLASQKTSSVKMLYNVILFSRADEQASNVEAAKSVYAYNGIQISCVSRMQLPYFLVSMPFLYTNNLEKDFALPTMMWPISSWNAVQYMPILSDWAGVGKGILLPTMREQFALVDPFSESFGTNYNIAVTGTSGGGKSFFIQMLMLNILFNGGDIFIIDIGGSYRKLCETLGGVYLEYSNLAMNPFTHVKDIMEEIDHIIAFFMLLACPSGASDDDKGTLRRAILDAFEKTKNDTLIDNVREATLHLYNSDKFAYPSARILAKNLEPYCTDAEHGKPFNAKSLLSPTARFIVVDLKEIKDKGNIRTPVLLSVLSQFQRRMFDSDRSKQKMCVIDEAWSFFSGDKIASDFVINGFRTGRRHEASFVTITQGIEDYYAFSEARAVWENAAMKFVFLQEPTALLEHQKIHSTFSELELSLLSSFPSAKHAGFSEVLFKTKDISSVHRLFVDPFTLVTLSSAGKDYEAVKNYTQEGLGFSDAVERVAREHYGDHYAS